MTSPIFRAAADGDTETIHLLREHVNDIDVFLRTPLHYAKNRSAAELLIKLGANPHSIDKTFWTPLHNASFDGRVGVVTFLLSLGVDIEASDKDGITPLHAAFIAERPAVAKALLKSGANLYQKDSLGKTPEDYASDHPIMERFLMLYHAWRRRRVMFLIREKGDPSSLLSYITFPLFRHITEFV
eukprot:GILK01012133.1.p1 GENE.GILK01012133.1~~GILK01012133.1.p1  ORF type:complete len:185 (+),score=11.74 GILK01012133.1:46-600(+)